MRIKILLSILLVTSVVALFSSEGCKNRPPRCQICDREIHRQMQAGVVTGGKFENTCCIACALHMKAAEKSTIIKTATDYSTGAEIDAASGVYLFNPQIETCVTETHAVRAKDSAAYVCFDRCHPSVVAFRNRSDALAVQKGYGGKVVSFLELQALFQRSSEEKSHH